MKTTTLILFSFITLLWWVFSGSSCKKDTPLDYTKRPQDTLYIAQDFLDYWYAEAGSWWVFKRTDTVGVDIYDTMRVVYHNRELVYDNLINGYSAFEKIDMYFIHSFPIFKTPNVQNTLAGQYDALILSSPYSNVNAINYGWNLDKSKFFYLPSNDLASMLSLRYPFVSNPHMPYIIENNDTMINTPYKRLSNTLKIAYVNNLDICFYISKAIGISRMEIQGGQVWELIDCKVIRTQ